MHCSLAVRLVGTISPYLLIVMASTALAQTNNGFFPPGGVGNYADSANWELGHLPTVDEQASIRGGRVATIDSAIAATPTRVHVGGGDATAGVPVEGTLNIVEGAELRVLSQMRVAIGGTTKRAIVNQSGGSLTVDDALFLGFDAWCTADYNLSGGSITTNNLWFRQGTATLTQTGGAISAGYLILAEGGFTTMPPNGKSFYDLKGGTIDVQYRATIGMWGADEFEDSFGTMRISGTGVATFGDLYFGTDETDFIEIVGNGVLNVRDDLYTEQYALEDIANGKIVGQDLEIRSVLINSLPYIQIVSTATIAAPGDFNGDGSVDAADYTVWRDNLGAADEAAIGNNGDGANGVDAEDYNLWKSNFGQSYSGSAGLSQSPVPEPGSVALLVVGILFLSSWSRTQRSAA